MIAYLRNLYTCAREVIELNHNVTEYVNRMKNERKCYEY